MTEVDCTLKNQKRVVFNLPKWCVLYIIVCIYKYEYIFVLARLIAGQYVYMLSKAFPFLCSSQFTLQTCLEVLATEALAWNLMQHMLIYSQCTSIRD